MKYKNPVENQVNWWSTGFLSYILNYKEVELLMLEIEEILDEIISSYCGILQENLVGIYLHGSVAMNCFNPLSSDIDFFVVVKEKLSFFEMRKLIDVLLKLSENGPKKEA